VGSRLVMLGRGGMVFGGLAMVLGDLGWVAHRGFLQLARTRAVRRRHSGGVRCQSVGELMARERRLLVSSAPGDRALGSDP
jgi:hypothetical protein